MPLYLIVNSYLQVIATYFLISFKSPLWLGHSRTFIISFWTPSSFNMILFLGNHHPIPRCLAITDRFFWRICQHLAQFIVSSLLSRLSFTDTEKFTVAGYYRKWVRYFMSDNLCLISGVREFSFITDHHLLAHALSFNHCFFCKITATVMCHMSSNLTGTYCRRHLA